MHTTCTQWAGPSGGWPCSPQQKHWLTRLAEDDLLAMMLANTMARLLMAGWRDSQDPISTLAAQAGAATENVGAFRRAINLSAQVMEDIPAGLPSPTVSLVVRRAVRFLSLDWLPRPPDIAPGTLPRSPSTHAVEPDDLALAVGLPMALSPVGSALEAFLDRYGPEMPAGPAVSLGSGDGAEPLRLARFEQITAVLAVDHSRLAVERMQRMLQRLRNVPEVPGIVPLRADVATLELGSGGTSVVVANHLLEYLEDAERTALYARIGSWLKPGGFLFANVHLAEGSRFDQLVRTGNADAQASATRVRVTIKELVPARTDAVQVQHFFTRKALEGEIEAALRPLPGEFELLEIVRETASGFTEAVCVVRRVR